MEAVCIWFLPCSNFYFSHLNCLVFDFGLNTIPSDLSNILSFLLKCQQIPNTNGYSFTKYIPNLNDIVHIHLSLCICFFLWLTIVTAPRDTMLLMLTNACFLDYL